jgi:hypothetical protein
MTFLCVKIIITYRDYEKINMKIKKGIFRIYIVLSIIWFCSMVLVSDGNYRSEAGIIALLTAIIPLPLFFVLKWILKGFE